MYNWNEWELFCLGRKASITISSDSVNSQGPQEKRATLPGMNLEWGRSFLPTTKPRLARLFRGGLCCNSFHICTEDLPLCEREKEDKRIKETKDREGKKTTHYMEKAIRMSHWHGAGNPLTEDDHLGLTSNTRERTEPHSQPDLFL